MTTPTKVLIVGAGPAGLEAALALHRLAGGRVATTVLSPETEFTYRPLSVLGPFATGSAAPPYPLARIAADAGFVHHRGALASVDPTAHAVDTRDGERLRYDVLLVATGAMPMPAVSGSIAFAGSRADQEAMRGLVHEVESGETRRVAFVVPAHASWPLPLYELALRLAERAHELSADVELHFITHEPAPLALFGPKAAREVETLLQASGIVLHTGTRVDRFEDRRVLLAPSGVALDVASVVTLPRLEGLPVDGLPTDASGFLVTDAHGRVAGVEDVYAAGDATAFAVKQGGIACQQADAAAEHIAAAAGADVEPQPFDPVFRGLLLTERWARFLRRDASAAGGDSTVTGRALWWPPAKIAGRELSAYLEGIDTEIGAVRGLDVRARVVADTLPVEVLNLH